MGSRGVASFNDRQTKPPTKKSLPTTFVQGFRERLTDALASLEPMSGRKLGACIGVYAFFDYDGEPIYVGQTTEDFRTRVGRHLRGQRSDTLAYRILDPFEVAEMELWPLERARELPRDQRRFAVDSLEYTVYVHAVKASNYRAILNEKIPPVSPEAQVPESYRFDLVPGGLRADREHPDVRIARRPGRGEALVCGGPPRATALRH